MYSPNHYRETDPALIEEVMDRYNFATLVSQLHDDVAFTHVPLVRVGKNPYRFIAHLARGNSQWETLAKSKVWLIFNGPHAYVSPGLYESNPANVPTWNYISIHCQCAAKIEEDDSTYRRQMQMLVETFEVQNGTKWKIQWTREQDALLRGVIFFELEVLHFEAKFKLSQNLEEKSKENVIQYFESTPETLDLSRFMRKVKGP